ncbi:single-stranded-DNA-specific exonuclease C-terminal domain-containing protein [Ammoniphilus sp. CFH 90114]|uniref:single-stranded-DNA-specific exonuclease C-terminal domain-containing protein n=1 Tax=Ammoniphilus sp. CFH 90114 TaxID=2493665 RepID=UPI0013E945A4|nr:single-stranded-DNA-specific exonuclease C-terminal domain-containing protein [Ammoniphilus sp. CFH 90114]
MLPSRTQWVTPEIDEQAVATLQREIGISSVLARLLVHRQLHNPEQARTFLHPSLDHLHSPNVIPGIEMNVARIQKRMEEKKPIVVECALYLDSVIAASLLINLIIAAGGPKELVQVYAAKQERIPATEEFVVTVGIFEETVHKEKIIIHPDILKGESPFPRLSCSGIAYKFAQALLGESSQQFLDLAALGTLAAQSSLIGENRIMVKFGLDSLKRSKNIGIKALVKAIRLNKQVAPQLMAVTILNNISAQMELVHLLTADPGDDLASIVEALFQNSKESVQHVQEETDSLATRVDIDAESRVSDWNLATIEGLELLAPFGSGNLPPMFIIRQAELRDIRQVGLGQQDLKCTLIQEDVGIEAVGSDGLGQIVPQVSKNAVADIVGEPAIHEWNGVRRPQFLIRDLAIHHSQIFDYRGTNHKLDKIKKFAEPNSVFLCFRKESLAELSALVEGKKNYQVCLVPDEQHLYLHEFIPTLFWYDMPHSMDELRKVLRELPQYGRLYCLFGSDHRNQLASIPSRDQFKWLYGLLRTRQSLRVESIPAVAKARGVSENAIDFMIQVFLELGFLKYERSLIEVVPTPEKKDLAESHSYKMKQHELVMETEILYSNFEVLCQIINQDKIIHNHT